MSPYYPFDSMDDISSSTSEPVFNIQRLQVFFHPIKFPPLSVHLNESPGRTSLYAVGMPLPSSFWPPPLFFAGC